MPLRTCDYQECDAPVARIHGSCMICASHFCKEHLQPPFHACPTKDKDADSYHEAYAAARRSYVRALAQTVDFRALEARASALRNHIKCTCAIGSDTESSTRADILSSQMSSHSCHVDLYFEDGVEWTARIRLDTPLQPPSRVRDSISRSEVATLKFLEKTQVPAPHVHHYALAEALDDVGVPYMLVDKLPGRVPKWSAMTAAQTSKVVSQLADISLELRRHPFDRIGSLTTGPEQTIVVGPYALPQLFIDQDAALGPFTSTNEAASSIISFYLDMYRTGERDDFPTDNTMQHSWRLRSVPQIYPAEHGASQFYLKHAGDTGDHILVDDHFTITAVLDWEWASVECAQVAFHAPCMLWPVAAFYDGRNDLADAEVQLATVYQHMGQRQMHDCVMDGRVHQRFWFFLGGPCAHRDELRALFRGLQEAMTKAADERHRRRLSPLVLT